MKQRCELLLLLAMADNFNFVEVERVASVPSEVSGWTLGSKSFYPVVETHDLPFQNKGPTLRVPC